MLGKTAELHARKTAEIASQCESNITKQDRHKSQSVLSVQVQPQTGRVASNRTRKLLRNWISDCGRKWGSRDWHCLSSWNAVACKLRPKLLLLCGWANLWSFLASESLLGSKCTLWLLEDLKILIYESGSLSTCCHVNLKCNANNTCWCCELN